MMFNLLFIFLFSLSFCQYEKLKKHSSVKVAPNTKVYLDLSDFDTGDLISFEIEMDLFFGSSSETNAYEFYIDQVPATSYYDPNYWNNLRKVNNANVSCESGDDCTFSWEEIKKEGNTYIYIIPPEPFTDFYTFWGEKIKIKNIGGKLAAGAIVGIVIGVIAFIVILIVLISCCCCVFSQNKRCCLCCQCCNCCCCKKTSYGVVVQANVPYQQPVYQTPVAVNPVYPAPAPAPAPVYPVTGQVYSQGYTSNQPPYSAVPYYA